MDNNSVTISDYGAKILHTNKAWQNYCIENQIIDPFKLIDNIKNERRHYKELYNDNGDYKGTEIIIDNPTKEQQKRLADAKKYRDSYMISREIWKGKYIFKNFGYNVLSKFAQQHSQGETAQIYDKAFYEWYRTIHPCESAKRQCAFTCPIFYSCALQSQEV